MAGFASIRQLNEVINSLYAGTPTELRRLRKAPMKSSVASGKIMLNLPYRDPFNYSHVLNFLRSRAVRGVEFVDGDTYYRSLSLPNGVGSPRFPMGWATFV